ncbi:MAG: hypothetical protein Q4A27_00665 [bacterium]|nr:hypothetical protein [bacterium]
MKQDYFYQNRAKRRFFKKMRENELFDLESELGSQVFGPAPNGIRREFFNLNATSWIWHEEYTDGNGQLRKFTTRYEIQPDKVVKIQPGPRYFEVKGKELENFYAAVNSYHKMVLTEIYHKNPRA